MGYVDDNLISDEKVTYRARLHWKVLVVPLLLAAVFIVLALAAFGRALVGADTQNIFAIAGAIFLLAAAVPLMKIWITVSSAEFAVTNKRVILKTGFIQKKTAEMFLAKIESVVVDQTITGRIMGYGTIVIRGTGGSLEPFSDISRPLEFRRQIQDQIGQSLAAPDILRSNAGYRTGEHT
jgi:uncharacterized membrane protein YdbT with pleckstrin-like domain